MFRLAKSTNTRSWAAIAAQKTAVPPTRRRKNATRNRPSTTP